MIAVAERGVRNIDFEVKQVKGSYLSHLSHLFYFTIFKLKELEIIEQLFKTNVEYCFIAGGSCVGLSQPSTAVAGVMKAKRGAAQRIGWPLQGNRNHLQRHGFMTDGTFPSSTKSRLLESLQHLTLPVAVYRLLETSSN